MTVGGMGFIPERLLMMMMTTLDEPRPLINTGQPSVC